MQTFNLPVFPFHVYTRDLFEKQAILIIQESRLKTEKVISSMAVLLYSRQLSIVYISVHRKEKDTHFQGVYYIVVIFTKKIRWLYFSTVVTCYRWSGNNHCCNIVTYFSLNTIPHTEEKIEGRADVRSMTEKNLDLWFKLCISDYCFVVKLFNFVNVFFIFLQMNSVPRNTMIFSDFRSGCSWRLYLLFITLCQILLHGFYAGQKG